ncbi:MAG: hypothetical protein RL642_934 [Bacteroidota bacterium]|jgi:hypothetical protein
MINLSNYEDWFLLYADGELTVAEQEAVLKFVELHPSLKEELDEIMNLRFQPETAIKFADHSSLTAEYFNELETTYRFEPDLTIQYPDKHTLYKRTAAPVVSLFRYAAVAASLIITAGLIWWSTSEDNVDAAVVKNEISKEAEVVSPLQPSIQEMPAAKDLASVGNENKKVVVVSLPKRISTKTNVVPTEVSVKPEQLIQDLVVNDPIEVPILTNKSGSNFSKEAIQAAEARSNKTAVVDLPVNTALPINTAAIIEAELDSEKQLPVRGFLRKISRTLLGERREENGDQKYVQFAVFSIPVQQ